MLPGVAGDDSEIHAWNNCRFAGVLGTLLPWLQWSDAGVEGGSGPPPWNLLWFALILEPKFYGNTRERIHTHIRIHTYTYIRIHTYVYIHIHTYAYVCIHIHT